MLKRSMLSGIVAVVIAAAVGWYAALSVERGRAFSDEQDAYQRFSHALTITDAMERIETLSRLIRHLTPETLPGAIRAYEEDVVDVYNNDLRMLMWYWAQVDPRGMVAHLQGWPEVRAVRMATGEAIYWIVRKEGFDAARAFYDQLPEHQRDPALPYLVLAFIESSASPDLIGFIESYHDRDERDRIASIIVGHLLFLNRPEDLVKWVEALPEGPGSKNDIKAVAFRGAVNELIRREQIPFLEEWFARVDQEEWAKGGRRAVAVNIVRRDPLRAIAWVEALTPEQGRDELLAEALRGFARYDRVRALEWMRSRAPDRTLDAGAARIAHEYARRDPRVALEMMLRIQDPRVFAQIRKTVTFDWKDLPEAQRAPLESQLEERWQVLGAAAPEA